MKKSIIALMGLFTLIACSEDSYQEADKMNETGTVENTEPQNSVKTWGAYHSSPFYPYAQNSQNFGLGTDITNLTPLKLELEPFGHGIHVQSFLAFNGSAFPPVTPLGFSFSAYQGKSFIIPPGSNNSNLDPGAPVSVMNPPYSNPQGNIVYDFGSFTPNDRMMHYGKIYYFKYTISNSSGVIASGYIKQSFFRDIDDETSIMALDPQWQYLTDVTGLPSTYDVVAVYSNTEDEICLTNRNGYTTPFPSQVSVTDPATGIAYTLDFTFPVGATSNLLRFH